MLKSLGTRIVRAALFATATRGIARFVVGSIDSAPRTSRRDFLRWTVAGTSSFFLLESVAGFVAFLRGGLDCLSGYRAVWIKAALALWIAASHLWSQRRFNCGREAERLLRSYDDLLAPAGRGGALRRDES